MPLRNKTEQEMEDCGRVNIHIFLSFLCQTRGISSTLGFLDSWLPFLYSRSWRLLNCPMVNKSLIMLCHQVQLIFNSKEMQLEEDNRAILKMSQKWACYYCFWEKSEETSQKFISETLVPSWTRFTALLILQLCLCHLVNTTL